MSETVWNVATAASVAAADSVLSAVANRQRGRQPQAKVHSDVVARGAFGVEQAGAPVDDSHRGVAVAQVAGGLDGGFVADGVEPTSISWTPSGTSHSTR